MEADAREARWSGQRDGRRSGEATRRAARPNLRQTNQQNRRDSQANAEQIDARQVFFEENIAHKYRNPYDCNVENR